MKYPIGEWMAFLLQVLNSNNGDINTEDNDMGQHSTLQLSKDRQEEDNSETK